MPYQPSAIEKKWQDYWEQNKTFAASIDHEKEKVYILDMFPYPSGTGLHVGHPEGYMATDIVARYKRMRGINVLHCMGWDAFGLPAEQYALKTGTHPKETTKRNIDIFRAQLRSLGFSYDWDREINTTDERYYKWTQWIFLQIFHKGLAYQEEAPVNWCPELRAVLANEEVVDGLSEIGEHPVIRKPLRQWVLKITEYADRLLDDLEELDWPEPIKEMQRNWIGKSNGAKVRFSIEGRTEEFEIYTTRPDTLFGVTYCVMAPEHALVDLIPSTEQKSAVMLYQQQCAGKSERARTEGQNEKTGIFTGAYAINPANGNRIPIWISDYVLASYGTGAIMAVPGHDQRDHDFATKFSLPILRVITGGEDIEKSAYAGKGDLVNSDFLNGLGIDAAKKRMIEYLEDQGKGEESINYKLRDWLFSRQRYWGEPIPVALDQDKNPFPISEKELPLILPSVDNYQPSENGESPLIHAQEWLKYTGPNGELLTRETNTMPQWAGSCWYFLRFVDPHNDQEAWSREAEEYWMPVDLYVGGAEHAVLHLLYARFWHKILYDLGYVHTPEPFLKLINQGIILGDDNVKMSKSRGNVINPDEVIKARGADALRLYEMFMGPLEKSKPWQTKGVEGIFRFLSKVWNLFIDDREELCEDIKDFAPTDAELNLLHRMIRKITEDIDKMKFNTAISQMMIFVNEYSLETQKTKQVLEKFVLLLSPFAPHLCEELWQRLGHKESLAYEPWPVYNQKYIIKKTCIIAIQINGKLRDKLELAINSEERTVMEAAQNSVKCQKYLADKMIKKIIFVPDRLLNLVVG